MFTYSCCDMRKTILLSMAIVIGVFSTSFDRGLASQEADPALRERARAALRKAVEFYRTKVSTEGEYHFATPKISATAGRRCRGADAHRVPARGHTPGHLGYLDAYKAAGDPLLLDAARNVARAPSRAVLQRRLGLLRRGDRRRSGSSISIGPTAAAGA